MREGLPTLEALYARLARPERPRLDEVMLVPEPSRGAPYGMRGQRWMAEFDQRLARAADRWEAMIARGILPEDWADDPRRRFSGERCIADRAKGTLTFAPSDDLPHPGSVDDVLTFACDPQGMLACEELARVAVRRIRPWSTLRLRDDVVWRTVATPRVNLYWVWFAMAPRTALERALVKAEQPSWLTPMNPALCDDDTLSDGSVRSVWQRAVRAVHGCAEAWRAAVALDLKVPAKVNTSVMPESVAKKRFAELEDPFAPLVDILHRGYFFEEMHASIALAAQQL